MRTGLLLAVFCRCFQRFALVGHVHNVHDRESVMMGLADRVIAVSKSVATTMCACGIAKRKIRIVLNRTLQSGRAPAIGTVEPAILKRPSIVTVCGMNQRKGIEELIDAFEIVARDFQDAQLYLVGDGPDRKQFERQADGTGCRDRIHFEGYQTLPQAYMLSADVFVLASRRESFGLVLIEAREAGCAIVATDVDGVSEALDGGHSGMLVPPRDSAALASALCRMLGSPAEREQWRIQARQNIDEFSVSQMASELTAIYSELIAADPATQSVSQFALAHAGAATVKMRSQPPTDDQESQAGRS
jgi:glycosyltransferase involved in cell wall biosynthesis